MQNTTFAGYHQNLSRIPSIWWYPAVAIDGIQRAFCWAKWWYSAAGYHRFQPDTFTFSRIPSLSAGYHHMMVSSGLSPQRRIPSGQQIRPKSTAFNKFSMPTPTTNTRTYTEILDNAYKFWKCKITHKYWKNTEYYWKQPAILRKCLGILATTRTYLKIHENPR